MNRTPDGHESPPGMGSSPHMLDGVPMPSPLSMMGRYGLRGRGMMLCALIWGMLAIQQVLPLLNPPPHGLMHYGIPAAVLHWLGWPLWLADLGRALVWGLPALYALANARHSRRSSRALGFLYVPAVGYALSYAGSFVLWVVGGTSEGYFRGLTSSVLYVAMCELIRLIAAIPAHTDAPLSGPALTEPPPESDGRPAA